MVAKELGLVEQTLRNWVKMAAAGKLTVLAIKVVTPEQMDLSRLRAENVRLKRECKILKKQRKFSLAEMCTILEVSMSGYLSVEEAVANWIANAPRTLNRPLKNYLRCRCGVKKRLKILIY